MKLSEINVGKSCTILNLHCEKRTVSRLNDLGIVEGVKVTVVRFAPLLDPIEIKVRNCYLAVRRSLANNVEVILC